MLKCTIGIRMYTDHELRGSDEVEHNITEHLADDTNYPTHSLGKRIGFRLRHIVPITKELDNPTQHVMDA